MLCPVMCFQVQLIFDAWVEKRNSLVIGLKSHNEQEGVAIFQCQQSILKQERMLLTLQQHFHLMSAKVLLKAAFGY